MAGHGHVPVPAALTGGRQPSRRGEDPDPAVLRGVVPRIQELHLHLRGGAAVGGEIPVERRDADFLHRPATEDQELAGIARFAIFAEGDQDDPVGAGQERNSEIMKRRQLVPVVQLGLPQAVLADTVIVHRDLHRSLPVGPDGQVERAVHADRPVRRLQDLEAS